MKKLFKTILVYTLVILCSSCYYNEYPMEEEVIIPPDVEASFEINIIPIFETYNCAECHNSNGLNPNLESDKAYDALLPEYVTPFNPESSKLYIQLEYNGHLNVDNESIAWIEKWIEEGAENN